MTTAGDLISLASSQLHGWGSTQDRVTPLSANMTDTATNFTVDFASGQAVGITPGVVEIDSEQLYVVSVDASTGLCVLADGFGRGYNGTTAVAHSAGAKVVSRPRFPRAELFKQLNYVVSAVYPQLFAVNTYTTTVQPIINTYTLPITPPMHVIDAQWQDMLGDWRRCPSYKIDPYDGTFRLGGGAMISRPLRILYSTQPKLFTAETDALSVTGLSDSIADLLALGVVAYQLPGLDISRAQLTSVESTSRSQVVPSNAGVSVGKYVMAEYQMRLANEAASLRRQYRARLTKVF